ncbi:benzoate 4-monooxygenase cytochrome P450 [Apiospora rasikravindrae]|uniref:Benzoate 4-monooxygenase cytochrome P450 n=1 Tax=Apiospora rasikravindrae TaxID=990691 RepID=A0ABR1S466_9PEZI
MRTVSEVGFAAPLSTALGVAALLIAVQLTRTYWRLRHIPGPFWARYTNFQRVLWVKTKQAHLIHQQVHEQYGPVVRTGPNMVMFNDPEAIPIVHTMRKGFPKAPFYDVFKSYTPHGGAITVFNATDEEALKEIKNPVAPLYSATNAMTFEPIVNEVLTCFSQNIEKRFLQHGTIFDLAEWSKYYAFDVMGMLTFSKRYSFLDEGEDVGGMLGAIITYMENAAPLTQIPWADKLLFKNWLVHAIRRPPSLPIAKVVAGAVRARQEQMEKGQQFQKQPDFLSRFMELAADNPELPSGIVSNWTFTNIIAGSDSVGAVIATMMFHLLQHPNCMQKLYTELQSANLTRPLARLSEIQGLPYLDACMWEAIRLHPAFALPFERVVPEGGITVGGYYLPEGTWVGGNPYVVNRHKQTFGPDAEFWRPERWLEGDEKYKIRLQQATLTLTHTLASQFGAGFRICIGRHIGIMEIKKMISMLIIDYDIQVVDPKLLHIENWWLLTQERLYVRIARRAMSTS